jgi:hypothetical protein
VAVPAFVAVAIALAVIALANAVGSQPGEWWSVAPSVPADQWAGSASGPAAVAARYTVAYLTMPEIDRTGVASGRTRPPSVPLAPPLADLPLVAAVVPLQPYAPGPVVVRKVVTVRPEPGPVGDRRVDDYVVMVETASTGGSSLDGWSVRVEQDPDGTWRVTGFEFALLSDRGLPL